MAHQKGEPFCFVAFFDIAKSLSFFAKKKSLRPRRLFHSFSFQQFYVRIFELFLTSKELNFSFGDQSMLDFCRNQFHCANQVGHLKKPVVRWRNRLEFHVFKQHAKNGCEQPPHLGLPIVVINLNSVKALEIVEMVFMIADNCLLSFKTSSTSSSICFFSTQRVSYSMSTFLTNDIILVKIFFRVSMVSFLNSASDLMIGPQ